MSFKMKRKYRGRGRWNKLIVDSAYTLISKLNKKKKIVPKSSELLIQFFLPNFDVFLLLLDSFYLKDVIYRSKINICYALRFLSTKKNKMEIELLKFLLRVENSIFGSFWYVNHRVIITRGITFSIVKCYDYCIFVSLLIWGSKGLRGLTGVQKSSLGLTRESF